MNDPNDHPDTPPPFVPPPRRARQGHRPRRRRDRAPVDQDRIIDERIVVLPDDARAPRPAAPARRGGASAGTIGLALIAALILVVVANGC